MNKAFKQFTILFTLIAAVGAVSAAQAGSNKAPRSATQVTGTWSGTLFSKHANVVPATMTIVISRNATGHLVGNSSLSSNCLRGAQLQVTVSGSTVVLAGSDENGDNITVRGTVDESGTLLKSTYIMNGSATGKCETDDGTADLAKR